MDTAHGKLQMNNVKPENYIERVQLPLNESNRSTTKMDYLVRIGLGHDTSRLSFYRKVMLNPQQAVNQQNLRVYVAEILDHLLDHVFNDTIIWNRLKTLLIRENQKVISALSEEISDSGFRALVKKSIDHEIPLETLLEVYSRGAEQEHAFKESETLGFERINSFIAGGAARMRDADLLGETVVKPYVETKDQTLSIVKRVLNESRKGKE